MKPPLDPDRIEQAIIQFSDPETADQFRVQTVAETGSTNDDAMDAARRKNSRSGLVIIADQQVIGRGRRGDAWIAPAGSSILMSILLRPESDLHPSLWPRLPHLAGLALAHAIERSVPTLRSRAMVKWPNDLYFDQKKIAGILVESQVGQPDQLPAIVVGLGLNVNTSPTDFPAELQETATSLRENTIDPENPPHASAYPIDPEPKNAAR